MIRVGPAGWSYKDWEGIVYPKPKPRGFQELTYIATLFDTLEINTSYYGPPRTTTITTWIDQAQANSQFMFTAKLYKGFTHDRNATSQEETDMKGALDTLRRGRTPRRTPPAVPVEL